LLHLFVLDIFSNLTSDVSILSSIAVITGVIFVAVQLRQNNKLISAAAEQAKAAVIQSQLTTQQTLQTNKIANMDMIMRLYEFADSAEFQSAWLTVLSSKLTSFEDFDKLPKEEQIAFYQVAALFESLGVLVERKIVELEIVEDMFLTELAWTTLQPFIIGMRKKFGNELGYSSFEDLNRKLYEFRTSQSKKNEAVS
jgi:hypothetical protein